MECRICGERAATEHFDRVAGTDTGEIFSIERCTSCLVLRTSPVPEDLSPYYATDLAMTMTRPGSSLFARLRRYQLQRELGKVTASGASERFLDVGCGTGDFARVIASRGFPVVAADSADEAPTQVRGEPGIPYARFDFDTYALEAADLPPDHTVILRHVLEHCRDPVAMLRRRREEGATFFYIVVPNVDCLERRLLGRYWYLWDPPRHLWHFDRSSLGRVCSRSGLVPIAQGTATAPTLLPALYRYLRLNHWPRRVYEAFGPTTSLTGLTAPLNMLVPGNVLWLIATAQP